MFESAVAALAVVTSPAHFGFLCFGVVVGLFIGIHLRQSVPPRAGNIVVGFITPVSAAAALIAISSMRQGYIEAQAGTGADPILASSDGLAYALFALNALVFCAATVSSYLSHDPDEKLDSSHSSLMFLDKHANEVRGKLLLLGTRLNGEIQGAKSRIERTRALSSQRIALYRSTNVRSRSFLPPPSFRKDPEFKALEWWPEVDVNPGSASGA